MSRTTLIYTALTIYLTPSRRRNIKISNLNVPLGESVFSADFLRNFLDETLCPIFHYCVQIRGL